MGLTTTRTISIIPTSRQVFKGNSISEGKQSIKLLVRIHLIGIIYNKNGYLCQQESQKEIKQLDSYVYGINQRKKAQMFVFD